MGGDAELLRLAGRMGFQSVMLVVRVLTAGSVSWYGFFMVASWFQGLRGSTLALAGGIRGCSARHFRPACCSDHQE